MHSDYFLFVLSGMAVTGSAASRACRLLSDSDQNHPFGDFLHHPIVSNNIYTHIIDEAQTFIRAVIIVVPF